MTDDDIVAALRELVPSLPDETFTDRRRPLRETVPHGRLRALVVAVQRLAPHVTSDAFTEATTMADVIAWISAVDGDRVDDLPPRGSYRSPNTTIRPVDPSDVPALYRAALRPQSAHRWRFRGRTPSPQEFEQVLFGRDVLSQFIVVEAATERPVGLVVGYDPDMAAGHCAVAAHRAWDDPGGGLVFEGMFILVQYLFDHFTFRKLYFDVPEYNLTLLGDPSGRLLAEEARLVDHYYFGDRFWDRVTFALYRSTWDELAHGLRGEWPDGHIRAGADPDVAT